MYNQEQPSAQELHFFFFLKLKYKKKQEQGTERRI